MIDIHTHILHGVDDGCKTLEESIMMIKEAVKYGISEVYLTPHYRPSKSYLATPDLITEKFLEIQRKVNELGLFVKLHLGREVDAVPNIVDLLQNGTVQTMGETKHILVDFGFRECDIDEYCYELIINGYKPIIAHPERYHYIDDYRLFEKWRKTGALIQVNSRSLKSKNKKIRKRMRYLLENDLIDFCASDCHNPKTGGYVIDKAMSKFFRSIK